MSDVVDGQHLSALEMFDTNLPMLLLVTQGPRPDALVIERTTDGGRTWQPARYMATNCRSSFPQSLTPRGPRPNPGPALGEASCYTLAPLTSNAYKDQKVRNQISIIK